MSKNANPCNCGTCVGAACTCGCQDTLAARRAGCRCGQTCSCGPDCGCPVS